jgi:hypothetical protein
MTSKTPSPEKVEVLKVWYSVFCTLVDAYRDGEYDRYQILEKLERLRDELADRFPEVEEEIARGRQ